MQAVFNQPPHKAIQYLEQKQLMPSEDWWRVQGNAHNKAFVISHMTRMDLLEDIRQSLIDAQKNGWDLKKWSEVIEPKMKARGWWGKQEVFTEAGQRSVQLGNPYRLKTIYQTNMAQAYEAGRQSVMFDDNPLFPYLRYSAILDNKTRPRHRALHGVVMLKSDPAWSAIAPKNGYNCRCTVIELMDGEVQGQKIKVYDSGSYLQVYDVDVSHGGIAKVAKLDLPGLPSFSTDAGWVGRPNALPTKQLMDKAIAVEPQIAANTVVQTFKNKSVMQQYNDEVKQWVQSIDAQKLLDEIRPVGVLPVEFLNALKSKKGIELESAAITLHEQDVLKSRDQFENIVEHLTGSHDLYWDLSNEVPLLIFDISKDGTPQKFVLQLEPSKLGNFLRSILMENPNQLDLKEYEFLISKIK